MQLNALSKLIKNLMIRSLQSLSGYIVPTARVALERYAISAAIASFLAYLAHSWHGQYSSLVALGATVRCRPQRHYWACIEVVLQEVGVRPLKPVEVAPLKGLLSTLSL